MLQSSDISTGWGGGPQMSMFEQISSDGYWQGGLMSGVVRADAGGGLLSKAQCIMGNGHMGPTPRTERQIDTSENITLSELHL